MNIGNGKTDRIVPDVHNNKNRIINDAIFYNFSVKTEELYHSLAPSDEETEKGVYCCCVCSFQCFTTCKIIFPRFHLTYVVIRISFLIYMKIHIFIRQMLL